MPAFPAGCGPLCPQRDWVSGTCERHGPTAQDKIVRKVVDAFKADVRTILKDDRDER